VENGILVRPEFPPMSTPHKRVVSGAADHRGFRFLPVWSATLPYLDLFQGLFVTRPQLLRGISAASSCERLGDNARADGEEAVGNEAQASILFTSLLHDIVAVAQEGASGPRKGQKST
jgi:hypothetical protein